MSAWRARVLIGVHVLMILHILHWLWTGRSISPIEPSEAMYTLHEGKLNAGFIFFALALLSTLVVGRFVCGWGCHLVAYQDLCLWLLNKVGIKPKPLRSRLLVLAPLALAIYMFIWPSVYIWWFQLERPVMTNHLTTSEFWVTFPGPVVAILTIVVCGFVIIYFLGAKGFCTYACPYGGFFGLVDTLSPGRIVVTDACEHCGHCTAVCTSNVRVHEEVALYGMVVDPGCMKCMDCVSVCPNDALHLGFKRPSLGAKAKAPRKPVPYSFTLVEEWVMFVVGLSTLLVFRGLYGQIPLLMAMGLASLMAYVFMLFIRLMRSSNVRLQQLQLKRGAHLTASGYWFITGSLIFFLLLGHSAALQGQLWLGRSAFRTANIPDIVWLPENDWLVTTDDMTRSQINKASAAFDWVDRWGLLTTPSSLINITWLQLTRGEDKAAERTMRRLIALAPEHGEAYRGLGSVLRKLGRLDEAVEAYRQALSHEPSLSIARTELGLLLAAQGRPDDALALYREGVALHATEHDWKLRAARLLMELGRFDQARGELLEEGETQPSTAHQWVLWGTILMQTGDTRKGVEAYRQAILLDASLADAHYNLGYALLSLQDAPTVLPHFNKAVELAPDVALYQYNLGVATFMSGNPSGALMPIREAIKLNPIDPDAHGFLAVLLKELGDYEEAKQAEAKALRLRNR